jgi:hypothetical protein
MDNRSVLAITLIFRLQIKNEELVRKSSFLALVLNLAIGQLTIHYTETFRLVILYGTKSKNFQYIYLIKYKIKFK